MGVGGRVQLRSRRSGSGVMNSGLANAPNFSRSVESL